MPVLIVSYRADCACCCVEMSTAQLKALAAAHVQDNHGNKEARDQIAAAMVYGPNVVFRSRMLPPRYAMRPCL